MLEAVMRHIELLIPFIYPCKRWLVIVDWFFILFLVPACNDMNGFRCIYYNMWTCKVPVYYPLQFIDLIA